MRQLHQIQLDILRALLFARSKRYSSLKPAEMEGSQFKFHMDKLISNSLVSKSTSGYYSLTPSGKEFANQMDSINKQLRQQAKVSVQLCPIRRDGSDTQYLLYTREKNPFFGHQGFLASKVWFGEQIVEAAKRALYAECNLTGEFELFAIRHYRVFSKDKMELLEDKLMHFLKVLNPSGVLMSKKDGHFSWVNSRDIDNFIKTPLPEFYEAFNLLSSAKADPFFAELDQIVDINMF